MDFVSPGEHNGHMWFIAVFTYVHMTIFNPIVTIMSIRSLFLQIPQAAALSIFGLASQALVFALVALSWTARVSFPAIPIDRISWYVLSTWYQLVGWAAVDNAVFAMVQFVLFYMAKRRRKGQSCNPIRPEEEPLLAH